MAEQLTDIITYRAAIIARLWYASLHFTMILMNKMYYWNYFENDYLNSRLGTDRPTDRLAYNATYRAAIAAKLL